MLKSLSKRYSVIILIALILLAIILLKPFNTRYNIPFLPVSLNEITSISISTTLPNGEHSERKASLPESKQIVEMLNSIQDYDSKISSHSNPGAMKFIEISLKNHESIIISPRTNLLLIVNNDYYVKSPEFIAFFNKL